MNKGDWIHRPTGQGFQDLKRLIDYMVNRPSMNAKIWKGIPMSYDEDSPSQEIVGFKSSHPISIRTQIQSRIESHQKQIDTLREIQEILNRNPDIEKFQDLLRRVNL